MLEDFARGRLPRDQAQRAIDNAANEPWFEHAYVRRELPDAPGFWPDMDFDLRRSSRECAYRHFSSTVRTTSGSRSTRAWRCGGADLDDLTIVRLAGTGHSPTLEGGNISLQYERSLLALVDDRVRS